MKTNGNDQITKIYGARTKEYNQNSIKARIEALFLDNIGKVITSDLIREVAIDPITKKEPENWHQRLSELRTDVGYTILSHRDREWLNVAEYLMVDFTKRANANKRVRPTKVTWQSILLRSNNSCEWNEGGIYCGLKEGEIDPIGGGKVKLTPDHKSPHSINPNSDPTNPGQWQALCGRHQVTKKNYWDNNTGKLNIQAIIQAASVSEKISVFNFLLEYFNYSIGNNNTVIKNSND